MNKAITPAKAKYFENNKSANSLWFISNGLPFRTQNDANNQARELEKKGKSGAVVEITRAEVEAWKAAEAGGNAPAGAPAGDENQTLGTDAGSNAPAGDENQTPGTDAGGNAPAGDENKIPGAPADKEAALKAAQEQLAAAKEALGKLAKNAAKAKKDEAKAEVEAAEALVAELSK